MFMTLKDEDNEMLLHDITSTIHSKLVAHLGLLDSFLIATAVQVANDGLRPDHHRS